MRVLLLTWEFPPFIAGGLGMACYGLAKALLNKGVEIDLLLPTAEDVCFPLRRPEDADLMPIHFIDQSKKTASYTETSENLRERLTAVGVSAYPESYITPNISLEKIFEIVKQFSSRTSELDRLQFVMSGGATLMKKVQEFTERALRIAATRNFDVIHAHDWLTYPAAILLKNLYKKPLLAHIHATEFDRAGGPGDERVHNIEYLGLSAADIVIAVSQYTAQIVKERYRIPEDRVNVVHNAYVVSSESEVKKVRIFKDPLILFMGRITLQKGPDYFIEVARRVLEKHPKVRFVMAGTGDMFSKMLKSSAAKRLKDHFLFSGFLNREQVEKILSATDIFVMPSVSEPFGIVPLEAMAFGSVAIVSRQSGVSEVISNAFKIDFWDTEKTADIILKLLDNPAEMKKIAEEGRKEVLTIGWNKAADETALLYGKALCST